MKETQSVYKKNIIYRTLQEQGCFSKPCTRVVYARAWPQVLARNVFKKIFR